MRKLYYIFMNPDWSSEQNTLAAGHLDEAASMFNASSKSRMETDGNRTYGDITYHAHCLLAEAEEFFKYPYSYPELHWSVDIDELAKDVRAEYFMPSAHKFPPGDFVFVYQLTSPALFERLNTLLIEQRPFLQRKGIHGKTIPCSRPSFSTFFDKIVFKEDDIDTQ